MILDSDLQYNQWGATSLMVTESQNVRDQEPESSKGERLCKGIQWLGLLAESPHDVVIHSCRKVLTSYQIRPISFGKRVLDEKSA